MGLRLHVSQRHKKDSRSPAWALCQVWGEVCCCESCCCYCYCCSWHLWGAVSTSLETHLKFLDLLGGVSSLCLTEKLTICCYNHWNLLSFVQLFLFSYFSLSGLPYDLSRISLLKKKDLGITRAPSHHPSALVSSPEPQKNPQDTLSCCSLGPHESLSVHTWHPGHIQTRLCLEWVLFLRDFVPWWSWGKAEKSIGSSLGLSISLIITEQDYKASVHTHNQRGSKQLQAHEICLGMMGPTPVVSHLKQLQLLDQADVRMKSKQLVPK